MERFADDILPAVKPAPRWQVPLLAAATAVVGASSFALAIARTVG